MELQLSVLHQRPVPGRPVHHRVRAGSVLSRRQVHDISSAESLLLEILTLTRCACVFSDFLGRTEVPVATIKKDQDGKGPLTRRLLLHEVPTGEVRVRLDLQLYEQTPFFWPRICRMKQLFFFSNKKANFTTRGTDGQNPRTSSLGSSWNRREKTQQFSTTFSCRPKSWSKSSSYSAWPGSRKSHVAVHLAHLESKVWLLFFADRLSFYSHAIRDGFSLGFGDLSPSQTKDDT